MEPAAHFADLFAQPLTWLLLAVYFCPTLVAVARKSSAWTACFLVNLFFGWTFVGWLLCVALAGAPTGAELSRRAEAARARDEFYLREREKARAS